MEGGKMKEWPSQSRLVQIMRVANGYIVRVDCQQFVFLDGDDMLQTVGKYLKNPREAEQEMLELHGIERSDKRVYGADEPCRAETACDPTGKQPGI
jgi:hypothetical protein